MRQLDDDIFDLIGARVVEECERRGVDGVFAMIDMLTPYTWSKPRWMLCRRDSIIDQASDGNTYNLLAIVFAKLAAIVGDKDRTVSGGVVKIIGEVPYMGGLRSANRRFIYAFSGASPEVDDEIVRIAEAHHKSFKESWN